MKYVAGAAFALFVTIGLPFWAQYAVAIAVAAGRHGVISERFAPELGNGLFAAPLVLMVIVGAVFGISKILEAAK